MRALCWQCRTVSKLPAEEFNCDTEGNLAEKRRYRLVPSTFIAPAVFVEDLQIHTRNVLYQLWSVDVHLGEAPTQGHYQAMQQFVIFILRSSILLMTMILRVRPLGLCQDPYLFFTSIYDAPACGYPSRGHVLGRCT